MKYQYATCCCHADGPSIIDMVEQARPVTLATIRRRCDIDLWERQLGYVRAGRGVRLARDYLATYYRSVFRGLPCYYIEHSRVEHIWTEGGRSAPT